MRLIMAFRHLISAFIATLAASSETRNVTLWLPSVCLSVPSAYSRDSY